MTEVRQSTAQEGLPTPVERSEDEEEFGGTNTSAGIDTELEHPTPALVAKSEKGDKPVAAIEERPVIKDKEERMKPTNVDHFEEPTLSEEFAKLASAIHNNPWYPEVSYILHWRDPIRTALLFGILNFAFYLVAVGGYTLLTLLSYAALTMLGVAFIYANGMILWARYIQGVIIDNPLSARWSASKWIVPRLIVEKHLDSVFNFVNAVLDISRDVFYCNYVVLSLKFAFIFLTLAIVGKWLSGLVLSYLVMLVLFAWPRLYEEKKTEIKHYYKLAADHINTYLNVVLSKLPKLDKRKTH
jgi:hypothetical protein